MKLSLSRKLETYKVVRKLKEDHMIDTRTYSMMLAGLGISENNQRVTIYQNGKEVHVSFRH
jgi:hypothetical protein